MRCCIDLFVSMCVCVCDFISSKYSNQTIGQTFDDDSNDDDFLRSFTHSLKLPRNRKFQFQIVNCYDCCCYLFSLEKITHGPQKQTTMTKEKNDESIFLFLCLSFWEAGENIYQIIIIRLKKTQNLNQKNYIKNCFFLERGNHPL